MWVIGASHIGHSIRDSPDAQCFAAEAAIAIKI
jgi:hypothetical protein